MKKQQNQSEVRSKVSINPESVTLAECLHDEFMAECMKNLATTATWEDVVNLGRSNLQYLINHWRYESRVLMREIRELERRVMFLKEHSTVIELEEYASKFEHPQEIAVKFDADGDSVPVDEVDLHRAAGSTTMNLCGWCKFCDGGICCGSCKLDGYCNLMPFKLVRFHNNEDRVDRGPGFNTECYFLECARRQDGFVQKCIAMLEKDLESSRMTRARCLARVRRLVTAKAESFDAPAFPDCKIQVDFPEGERVRVLVRDTESTDLDKIAATIPKVYRGLVVANRYNKDGFNSPKLMCRDLHEYTARMCAEIGMSNMTAVKLESAAGMDRPWYTSPGYNAMLEADFQYLCKNADYQQRWLESVEASRHAEQFRAAWSVAFEAEKSV